MTLVVTVVGVLIPGLVLYFWTKNSPEETQVDLPEFIFGGALCVLVVLLTLGIGSRLAVENKIGGYQEFWNGSIVAAQSERIPCDRDGRCVNEYRCDPYTVMETRYRQVYAGTDSKGNAQYRSEPYQVPVTHYHSCPYATEEFSYWLNDSFGETHEIASGVFSASPVEWRAGSGIPGEVFRGVPPQWQYARDQIEAGTPPPATKVNSYVNYILASTDSLLKQYSADIKTYRKDGLLPPHTAEVPNGDPLQGGWTARKFQAVGGLKADQNTWNDTLGRLNAALGSDRQGDMHVVALPASRIQNPDAYINALLAYWQGPDFGKWSLAKNGIVVVVGVNQDGTSVEWVRAKTGMPVGNGEMISALNSIKGVPFEPATLIGAPKATWKRDELSFRLTDGEIERIVLDEHPFKRACMSCEDPGEAGGYVYLKAEVTVSTAAKIGMFFIAFLLSSGVWAVLYFYPLGTRIKQLIKSS